MKNGKYGKVYTSLDELLKENPQFITENSENYYVRLKPEGDYDNRMWQVDKATDKVTSIFMTAYFSIEDSTKPVDITSLKKNISP